MGPFTLAVHQDEGVFEAYRESSIRLTRSESVLVVAKPIMVLTFPAVGGGVVSDGSRTRGS